MAVRFSIGAALSLGLAASTNAQAPAKADAPVGPEAGPAVETGASSGGVRLLGGTVCLPGTGMFFYSGPPEPRDAVKDRGSEDSPAIEPASQSTQEPPNAGAPASDAAA